LQSHLYLFCNHTAIKLQSRTCLFMQLGFFAIATHQRFATTLSRMFAITCIFHQVTTTSSKDQSSHNFDSVMALSFFLNWFIAIALFYKFFAIAIILL
jgi:hypothetical protein